MRRNKPKKERRLANGELLHTIPEARPLLALNEHDFRNRFNNPNDPLRKHITWRGTRRYMTQSQVEQYLKYLEQESRMACAA